MAGAPLGNNNAAKSKVWQAAITRALEARTRREGVEALDILAEKLLQKAEEGEISALKELGDRLEGKSAQAIIGDPENPLNFIHKVERVIVSPEDKDS